MPSGTYDVECEVPCTVFVVGKSADDVKSSKALAKGDKTQIEITEGSHIGLSVNGKISMRKK